MRCVGAIRENGERRERCSSKLTEHTNHSAAGSTPTGPEEVLNTHWARERSGTEEGSRTEECGVWERESRSRVNTPVTPLQG